MKLRIFSESYRLVCGLAVIFSVALVVLAGAQTKGGSPEARAVKNPVTVTPASLADGATKYKKYCAYCHADDGKGDGPLAPKDSHPPDLTDTDWVYGSSDGEMFAVIQKGLGAKSDMKPFKGKLTEQDTWNVINYVRSLRKAAH